MTTTAQFTAETSAQGDFVRQGNRFRGRMTADGSSGFPVEPGRYQLYVSLACPWAQRTLIVRELLGLQDAIGVTVVDPIRDQRGWRFTHSPAKPVPGGATGSGTDPATGAEFLADLYRATDPAYEGRVTVPCIWDRETRQMVTNDYPQITLDLSTEWTALHRAGAPRLYPEAERAEMDELIATIYRTVNNGVYKAGFAISQEAYERAYDGLFATLDDLDRRLASRRFLMGEEVREVDIRLFTTLARFDAVYYSHFKCNRQRLTDYSSLWPYARDLYAIPGFGSTTDFDHIKRHYYGTHDQLNPSRIVPKGPDIDWTAPAGRG